MLVFHCAYLLALTCSSSPSDNTNLTSRSPTFAAGKCISAVGDLPAALMRKKEMNVLQETPDQVIAVSYTHLDVYKRQL